MPNVAPHYCPLPGSERSARGQRLRPADPAERISVSVHVRRPADAPPLPDQEYWAAVPPNRRAFLSRDKLAQQNAASQVDLDLIIAFARDCGLTIDESQSSAKRRYVVLSASVALMNAAFGVDLGIYIFGSQIYRGREGPIHVPRNLVQVVEGIFGFDTRSLVDTASSPPATSPVAPERLPGAILSPDQVAALYKFPKAEAGMGGQCIALLSFADPDETKVGTGGFLPTDIEAYFNTYQGIGPGFPTPTVSPVVVKGLGNRPNRAAGIDDLEITGDIQLAGTAAPGVGIGVYFTTWDEDGWIRAIKRIIYPDPGDPEPSIISISIGAPEFALDTKITWSRAAVELISGAFREAAQAGITVLAASGDGGSNCGVAAIGSDPPRAHVLYPASDPWVTACGGTIIRNLAGSVFAEATWPHTGGGVSDIFPLPTWQVGANIPLSANSFPRKGRGVPDIAGYANGYCIVVDGTRLGPFAGTSGVVPLYAGLIARINATLGHNVGYLNPTLYYLGVTSAGMFSNICDGASNASGGAPGYTSIPGWNACTGWGSINGIELMRFL